jgi:hypothetical protein
MCETFPTDKDTELMATSEFKPGMNDPQGRYDSDLQMVPMWSIVLAAVMFCLVQYVFFEMMPRHHNEILAFRVLTSFTMGTALASYILLIGYVSRDVKRRNMSARLWMLIVLLLPGGIGAVVYFLLRQPTLMVCAGCHSQIPSSINFCPQCRYQSAAICGVCHRSVRATDVYCTQCGHDLAEDHTPSRLRA